MNTSIQGVPLRGTRSAGAHCAAPAGNLRGRQVALRWAALLALAAGGEQTLAQGVATDRQLEEVVVNADRLSLRPLAVPATTATVTAADLRLQNLFNPEDTLRYAPNTTIRKRYIGDRNALIGGRSFSPLQPPRALVLMDGYLMSNFLARFDAPRWNMIAPEEIERVDIIYGPFSALYAGNSIGTTVVMRTRTPEKLTVGSRLTMFSENYDEYGHQDRYNGTQFSGYIGNRFDNGAWISTTVNRQDNTGHPMQFYTVSTNAAGAFPTVNGAATPVTGVKFDTDPNGRRRAVFGPNSGAIDDTQQTVIKVRGGYDAEDWALDAFVGGWRNESGNRNQTFMRDAAGNPVWSGRVSVDGIKFNVPNSAFAPFDRVENHMQAGITLRTKRKSGWNGSIVASTYRIMDDAQNTANSPDAVALSSGGAGTLTLRNGTHWNTFEAQGTWETADAAVPHSVAVGYHRNDYRLDNPTYALTDWRNSDVRGALTQNVGGRTELQAVYLQDTWRINAAFTLTSGIRYERWRAFDGQQFFAGLAPLKYPERSISGTSPKISLAYMAGERDQVRLSAGRGIRFPTVPELFQGSKLPTSIQVADPNLRPERSDAVDLTWTHRFSQGDLRLTAFQDDVRDSIYSQTNITVTPNVTNIQNVGRVRTRGLETAFSWSPAAIAGLSLNGNFALVKAEIVDNPAFPASEGKNWPRIPRERANLQVAYAINDRLTASMAGRWSGRMYNTLDNTDINPDVYGGVSRAKSLDLRVGYDVGHGLDLALGVDNLTGEPSYQAHPLQGRTLFAEVRWTAGD